MLMKRGVVGLIVAASVVLACTGEDPAVVIAPVVDGGSEADAAGQAGDAQTGDAAGDDAGTCTLIVYPVQDGTLDDPAAGFHSSAAPEGGTIQRDASGIVLTSAADQVAVLVAQIPDRASVVRLSVRGRVTVRASEVALAPVGVYIADLGTTVGHVDLVRGVNGAPGIFYGTGTSPAITPLASAEDGFPTGTEVPFELVFRGRWKDGPTVDFTVGTTPGTTGMVQGYTPASNNDQVLNIAVGVSPPQPAATVVRLHALSAEVCRR